MTFKYRYRKQIIIGVIIFIVAGSLIGFGIYKYIKSPKKKKNEIVVERKLEKKEEKKVDNTIQVDIKGEINNPGIYKVSTNSRVIDQTTPNMIQRISGVFERKPLISRGL